jgi:hypothetical protein
MRYGNANRNHKTSLLPSLKKENSSFLKKRSKRLLIFMYQLDHAFPLRTMISSG